MRPWSTVLLFAKESGQLPFDVAPLRAMPYQLTTEGKTKDTETTKIELVKRLKEAKQAQNSAIDSPIFQLVEGFPEIDHTKTDVFRDRVQYSAKVKEQIADARKQGKEALSNLEKPARRYQRPRIRGSYRSFSFLSCCQRMARDDKFSSKDVSCFG